MRVLSSDEARERGRQGGKASAEARAKKRSMADNLRQILYSRIDESQEKMYNALVRYGVPKVNHTNATALMAVLFNKAVSGDMRAMEILLKLLGELGVSMDVTSKGKSIVQEPIVVRIVDASNPDDNSPSDE